MEVEIKISENVNEPYAIIYTREITDDIKNIINMFEKPGRIIANDDRERIIVLTGGDVYMVRVEKGLTAIYTKDKRFTTRKKLYEMLESLGQDFLQISKAAIVNLRYLDYVEPYFNSMMKLMLKNGCGEYISRTYLPEFKRYIGYK